MLTARIRIGNSNVQDTRYYGLVYLSSDNIVGPPSKGFEETSYPEQGGVNVCPKTVDDAFDYKVTFFIQEDSLDNANEKIRKFNRLLYDITPDSDVKTYKKVYFYNDYKNQMIVGYPKPMSEAKDFWRDPKHNVQDVVIVEWTIRVANPGECNFSTVLE